MEKLWLILGFIAQFLFASRFLIQWIASEKAGHSIVPIGFWFLSVTGGALLFVYAVYRRDPVFIVGQGSGLFVYLRNLYMIMRDRKKAQKKGIGFSDMLKA